MKKLGIGSLDSNLLYKCGNECVGVSLAGGIDWGYVVLSRLVRRAIQGRTAPEQSGLTLLNSYKFSSTDVRENLFVKNVAAISLTMCVNVSFSRICGVQ